MSARLSLVGEVVTRQPRQRRRGRSDHRENTCYAFSNIFLANALSFLGGTERVAQRSGTGLDSQ